MTLLKHLVITLSFVLVTASYCAAQDTVTPIFQEKTRQQKVGGVVKEGSFAALCFFVASFITKGIVPQEYEQVAALLLGMSSTALVNRKTVKEVVTHPVLSVQDPETVSKVCAMVLGGVAGNYAAGYTSGAKNSFSSLNKTTK